MFGFRTGSLHPDAVQSGRASILVSGHTCRGARDAGKRSRHCLQATRSSPSGHTVQALVPHAAKVALRKGRRGRRSWLGLCRGRCNRAGLHRRALIFPRARAVRRATIHCYRFGRRSAPRLPLIPTRRAPRKRYQIDRPLADRCLPGPHGSLADGCDNRASSLSMDHR